MSASNYNWLCFDCRIVTRQPKPSKRVPKCFECGDDMFCLGYKVEVPKKEDIRGWRRLREDCRERELTAADARHVAQVREQHDAERRIAQLAALPENKQRAKLIAELRKKMPRKRSEPMVGPRTAMAQH
jgi:hypothetical protein